MRPGKRPEREKTTLFCSWLSGLVVLAGCADMRNPASRRSLDAMPERMPALRLGMSADEILNALGAEKARPQDGSGPEEHYSIHYFLSDRFDLLLIYNLKQSNRHPIEVILNTPGGGYDRNLAASPADQKSIVQPVK